MLRRRIQGREAAFQESIDEDLAATQALIERTQTSVDALVEVANPTAEQETELQALEGRLASLRSTYATLLSFSSGSATNLLTVLDPAAPPTSPVSPRILFNTLLAAALGMLVVVGVAFVAEQLDDRIKDPDAVQDVAGLSTLGTIARMTSSRGRKEFYQLAGLLYPRSSFAEAYRTLRTNIEFASLDSPVRTLLVTSSAPGEGKTVTAANLAIVFAQSGRTVILVDADLRKPGVDSIFNLPNTRGLTDLLRHQSISVEAVANPTEQDNLRVVTTGPLPPNPAELLGSKRMRTVVQRLQEAADLVIFDSPPLLAVTDAAVMGSFLDGTLFVIDAAKGRRRLVRLGRETLARSGTKTLGAYSTGYLLSRGSATADFYGRVGRDSAAGARRHGRRPAWQYHRRDPHALTLPTHRQPVVVTPEDAALPKVTLVVAMRNEAPEIRRCLASIAAQDYPADLLEVLVYDGLSTDGSFAAAREVAGHRPDWAVLSNPRRIQAAAWNAAYGPHPARSSDRERSLGARRRVRPKCGSGSDRDRRRHGGRPCEGRGGRCDWCRDRHRHEQPVWRRGCAPPLRHGTGLRRHRFHGCRSAGDMARVPIRRDVRSEPGRRAELQAPRRGWANPVRPRNQEHVSLPINIPRPVATVPGIRLLEGPGPPGAPRSGETSSPGAAGAC